MVRDAAFWARNGLLPLMVGIALFSSTLCAFLYLTAFDHQLVAAIGLGAFALLVSWIALERPNSDAARACSALVDRLLQVGEGDLTSPSPDIVHRNMPAVGQAVDRLFAQVRASIDAAHAMALHDPVTGLPNRVHFRVEVEKMLEDQGAGACSALMFIDLDRFKAVNDNLGHAHGDEVLVMVAGRLLGVAASKRRPGVPTPLVARLAGDEFTMFFPQVSNIAEADRIGKAVLAALSEPYEIPGHSFDVGASIGVAVSPGHGVDLPALMRASDIAMYQAKASGRGQVCLFDELLANAVATRARTEADLRFGLENDEFELYFQPQVTSGTGEIVGAEALLRWHHPRDGLRLPASFIGIAEECGLIIELGDWVIEAAAATLARWRAAGIGTRLALNISPRQLYRPQFFIRLREAMERAGADLAQLELEFTEVVTMAFDEAMLREVAALRRDGVLIALDDFGKGYSSLARLKQMPIDRIKIDRSLVFDIDANEDARVIIQAVVQLVHGAGCVAVAEGVETDAQIALLRLVSCDMLQGHVLAEPMPGSALLEWMAAWADAGVDVGMDVGRGNMRAITAA